MHNSSNPFFGKSASNFGPLADLDGGSRPRNPNLRGSKYAGTSVMIMNTQLSFYSIKLNKFHSLQTQTIFFINDLRWFAMLLKLYQKKGRKNCGLNKLKTLTLTCAMTAGAVLHQLSSRLTVAKCNNLPL